MRNGITNDFVLFFSRIFLRVRLIILGILSCGHSSKHFNKPLEPTIRNNGIDIVKGFKLKLNSF